MSDAMPRSLAEKIVWLQQQLDRERRAEEDERTRKQIIINDSRPEQTQPPPAASNSSDVAPVACAPEPEPVPVVPVPVPEPVPEPEPEPELVVAASTNAEAGTSQDEDEQKDRARVDVSARAHALAAAEARRTREHTRSRRPVTAARVRPVRRAASFASASAPSTQGQKPREAPIPCQSPPVAGTPSCVQCHKNDGERVPDHDVARGEAPVPCHKGDGPGERVPGNDVARENERPELGNEAHAPPAEGNDQANVTEACNVSIKIEVEDYDGVVRAMPVMLQLKLKEEEDDKADVLNLSDPKGSDDVRGQELPLGRGEKDVSNLPTQTNEPQPRPTDLAATQATTSAQRMVVDKAPEVLPDPSNNSRRNTLSHTWSMTSERLSLSTGQKRTRPDDRDDGREEDERERGNESISGLDRTPDTRERRSTWPGGRKRARRDSGMVLEAPALQLVQTARATSSRSVELSSGRSDLGSQDADDTPYKTRRKALESTPTTKEVERYWVQASRGTLQAAARLCQLRAQMKILDMEMAEILRHLGEVEVAVENIPV